MNKMIKDVQNQQDTRNISIQKVGIKDVEIPLKIERKNQDDTVVFAKAKMSVNLPSHYKGTHMSRFVEILNKYRKKTLLSNDIKNILVDMKKKLNAQEAYIKLSFKYFIEKFAPVSKKSSLMCYNCAFEGEINQEDKYIFYLDAEIPITTLCPCSKEISKYGAHNQRALLKIKISYDLKEQIWLEDLIKLAESCASSDIYPLLKREDEKYVTEHAFENPKFVEDIIRDTVLKLRENKLINSYEIEMTAMESIHNHNAWAYQKWHK